MNAFMVFLIKRISYTVGKKIHFDVIKMVSAYDSLIDEKSKQLQLLNSKISNDDIEDEANDVQKVQIEPILQNVKTDFIIKARYVDDNFPNSYKLVRNEFKLDKVGIINTFKENHKNEKDENIYNSILEKISFETFYNIATLDCDKQISVFKEYFNNEEKEIIDDFSKKNKNFKALVFYNYLKNKAKTCDNRIYIRTSDPKADYNFLGSGIATQYDNNLCEGFCIVSKEYLYDYSIAKMEIC